MGIGVNLVKRMEQLGWEQKDLVEASGVSQQAINATIKRDSNQSRFLQEFSTALDLSIEQLLSGSFEPPKTKPDPKTKKATIMVKRLEVLNRKKMIDDNLAMLINTTVDAFTSKNNEIAASDTKAVDGVLNKLEVDDG